MAEKAEDRWVETLRKSREANQRMHEHLEILAPAPTPSPVPSPTIGIPCE